MEYFLRRKDSIFYKMMELTFGKISVSLHKNAFNAKST